MAFGFHIIVVNEDPKEAHLATLCNLHFLPKNPKPIIDLNIGFHSTFLSKHLNYQSMSSIPSNVENELHKLLELFIPSAILLTNLQFLTLK
jgi:hypothetical protein